MDIPHSKIKQFHDLLCGVQHQFSLRSLVERGHFSHHVSDMECVAMHLRETVVVELGAGVGLNIFLLAMLCPNRNFVAVEKHSKRRGWMQIQKQTLQLENIEIEPNLSGLKQVSTKAIGLLLKAFSPKAHLPKLLMQCPDAVMSVYVVEGVQEGLSHIIPKSLFVEMRTVEMMHGRNRFLKIFQRTSSSL